MTDSRDRLAPERPARRPNTGARIPRIFVLGVAMMALAVGTLLLRSTVAGGSVSAVATGSPAVASATSESAGSPDPMTSAGTVAASNSTAASISPSDAAGQTPSLTGYVWPLDDPVITLPFGPSDWGEFFVDGQRFHDGVDMATKCGDYVHAAHDGVVLAASRQYDDYMGWIGSLTPYYHLLDTKHWWDSLPIVIVIDDGDGYRSIYAHEYQVTVKPGQHVTAGQIIGYEGATGNATGCHVHFGLFSPTETATFELDPAVVAKDLMPKYEIARIDPLLVLPFSCAIEEMRTLRPAEAAACPPLPSPSTPAKASATPAKASATPAKASATPAAKPTPIASWTPQPSTAG